MRKKRIEKFEEETNFRVIVLNNRQEDRYFRIFFRRYIDIEDSEDILRAIRLTPKKIVLHTSGALVLAGTLQALTADKIIMDDNVVLDPAQILSFSAVSILKV